MSATIAAKHRTRCYAWRARNRERWKALKAKSYLNCRVRILAKEKKKRLENKNEFSLKDSVAYKKRRAKKIATSLAYEKANWDKVYERSVKRRLTLKYGSTALSETGFMIYKLRKEIRKNEKQNNG